MNYELYLVNKSDVYLFKDKLVALLRNINMETQFQKKHISPHYVYLYLANELFDISFNIDGEDFEEDLKEDIELCEKDYGVKINLRIDIQLYSKTFQLGWIKLLDFIGQLLHNIEGDLLLLNDTTWPVLKRINNKLLINSKLDKYKENHIAEENLKRLNYPYSFQDFSQESFRKKTISQEELEHLIDDHNLYMDTIGKKGKKLILEDIDFTGNDLSRLDFYGVFIVSSLFDNHTFKDKSFGRAELYSCIFKNTTFENCNLRKTVLSYVNVINCKFNNCNLLVLDTFETRFIDCLFEKCNMNGAFRHCLLKNIVFKECSFIPFDFWQSIIENVQFSNHELLDIPNMIENLNAGTFLRPQYLKGIDAVNHFKENIREIQNPDI